MRDWPTSALSVPSTGHAVPRVSAPPFSGPSMTKSIVHRELMEWTILISWWVSPSQSAPSILELDHDRARLLRNVGDASSAAQPLREQIVKWIMPRGFV